MDERDHNDADRTLPPFQDLSEAELTEPVSGGKRLYRRRDNKLFMGVCSGLATYFDTDPTLVRVIFVVSTLLGGASIFIYLVLIAIMPAEDQLYSDPREAAQLSFNEATSEIQRGVDLVVEKAKTLTGRKTPPSETPPV